ncbi:MAG: ribosome hibernation-promoting factor, HPF/YfiA family [Candidatus Omnitrophota bacterium]
MDIRFTGQNFKITAGMRGHLEARLPKLEKYVPKIIEAHVFLKKVKYLFVAEITVLAKDVRAFGKGSSKENVFASMDDAYDRVVKQLKKHRGREKNHHQKKGKSTLRAVRAAEAMVESELALGSKRPRIVSTEDFAVKPMSPEEASLQLEVSGESFLVFVNPVTNSVNVLYQRKDGDHGLIEPQF